MSKKHIVHFMEISCSFLCYALVYLLRFFWRLLIYHSAYQKIKNKKIMEISYSHVEILTTLGLQRQN